jgi:fatty acid synthase
MTIHEHDGLPSGIESGNRTTAHALVDRLNAGEPYAVAFGGQGSSTWLASLEEIVTTAGIESELARIADEAEALLEPVADELVVVRPIGFEPLRWIRALAAGEPVPTGRQLVSAAVSIPGVLLTQIAATRALSRQGIDFADAPPVALAGHDGRRGIQGRWGQGRRAARTGSARRGGRHTGRPPPRRHRAG